MGGELGVRILLDRAGPAAVAEATDEQLRELYSIPREPWLRVNFVESVDGAATGAGGKSGSINNAADKRVFELLRDQADVIVVGTGTARVEGYRPAAKPIVLVTASGRVPETLVGAPRGAVLVATHAGSSRIGPLRAELGEENVLVVGETSVDLVALTDELISRGHRSLLSEGGPTLFAAMLSAGVVDEVCTTVVPRLVGGLHTRIAHGADLDVPLTLATLVEEDGTLLSRWFVHEARAR